MTFLNVIQKVKPILRQSALVRLTALAALLTLMPAAHAQEEAAAPAPKENLSFDTMKERSSKAVDRMKKSLNFVLGRLEEARKSKDIIKQNCVNDRLTNIKGMLRISEQADMSLLEAAAAGDSDQARHALGTVEANSGKVEQLAAESAQCIGMLSFDTSGMKRTVETPDSDDEWDPAKDQPEISFSSSSRPVSASPVE